MALAGLFFHYLQNRNKKIKNDLRFYSTVLSSSDQLLKAIDQSNPGFKFDLAVF